MGFSLSSLPMGVKFNIHSDDGISANLMSGKDF